MAGRLRDVEPEGRVGARLVAGAHVEPRPGAVWIANGSFGVSSAGPSGPCGR